MMRIRIIILVITVVALFSGHALMPEKKIDERAYLEALVSDVTFSEKKGVPPHFETETGLVAFNTYDVVPSIRGYAAPIKLLLALSPEGMIEGVKILEHRETKNYVHFMESREYLNQFVGKSVHDPFEIDRDIDAISRATVSVEALSNTIRESSRRVASQVHGLDVRGGAQEKQFALGWVLYLLLFTLAALFYFITRKSSGLLRIRDVFLLLSVVIIGLYLSTPFSMLHMFNLLLMRFSSSILWYVVVISTLVSIASAGRFYCGWLCPYGALSEFVGRLPLRKWNISTVTDDRWRNLKYVLLCVVIAAVSVSRHTEYGNFETYVTLFSFHGTVLTWALVAAMLLINMRVERFWCRYLCPVGALTGTLSRKDRGYISRDDCPMANKPVPLISECIRCNRCYNRSGNLKKKGEA
jgi:Na+-translocating ferredoxin:NAD+ oxidoreductase RnfG subunit